jgi:hypothetical protein
MLPEGARGKSRFDLKILIFSHAGAAARVPPIHLRFIATLKLSFKFSAP